MPPTFLHIQEVLEVHRNQIELYGGSEGIRDIGLLESAIATPQAGFGGQYLHSDIFEWLPPTCFISPRIIHS